MAAKNKKTLTSTTDQDNRLAGGFGNYSAKSSDEDKLRRLVMACLLWEDNAYVDGVSIANEISELIPKVNPLVVAKMAVDARFVQKLRHVPLFICRQMLKHDSHKAYVEDTLSKIIHRPDEMGEFLSLYWADNNGKKSIPATVKRAMSVAFNKFNEYQLAKYNRDKDVKLCDILNLCHPRPDSLEKSELWKRLLNKELSTPNTWEVLLSSAKTNLDKKSVWESLLKKNELGATAFLKNLRNMISVKVDPSLIRGGLTSMKKDMLVPLDFLKAQQYAPDYTRELEDGMFQCANQYNKLKGKTVLVVDVSGSMTSSLSSKSDFTRMDAAIAMAVLTAEISESVSIYATAGSDGLRKHQTKKVNPFRGFALKKEIMSDAGLLGGGGIFTRQCLEYIKEHENEIPDRMIVFSDSQDCDLTNQKPSPFGKKNYIVDVSSHSRGINYKGVWSAEISGWSDGFLRFISEDQ